MVNTMKSADFQQTSSVFLANFKKHCYNIIVIFHKEVEL